MDRVTVVALALLASGTFGTGCGDDDDSTGNGQLDGGRLDSSIADGGNGDGSSGDGATFPCTSWTAPTASLCGGSHCQDTLAEVRAGAASNAVCGGDLETSSFCQLEVVNAVSNCTRDNFGSMDPNAITNCAAPQLPGFSSTCLACFVDSAKCAALPANCLNQCALNPQSTSCDRCRVEKGCISQFYTCAGLTNPVPASR